MTTERDRLAEGLLSFALLAPKAVSHGALLEALMERIRPYGVTHVIAGVLSDADRNFKLGARFGQLNMAWLETYLGRQLYRADPVVDFALRAERAVYWDQAFAPERLGKGARVVLGVARDFGMGDGFMAPVPLFNGDIVIVSFQGPRLERHPDVEATFRGLAGYFGAEGQRLIVRSRLHTGAFAGLTSRQIQVLHLAALGRRNQDIAEELGIRERTVEFHLARARERMGAHNTKEAVALINATPANLFAP